jgi:hypothetical protein
MFLRLLRKLLFAASVSGLTDNSDTPPPNNTSSATVLEMIQKHMLFRL